jgi:uroporphyrinogen decarboxylase
VGTQSALPFGTPAEVKENVKRRIEVLGAGGGLLISPSQSVEPDVPWENVLAFFEAAEEFGNYS